MFSKFMAYLKEILQGRGFLASFLVISGWVYVIILILVLLFQIILYILGVAYTKESYNNFSNKDRDKDN